MSSSWRNHSIILLKGFSQCMNLFVSFPHTPKNVFRFFFYSNFCFEFKFLLVNSNFCLWIQISGCENKFRTVMNSNIKLLRIDATRTRLGETITSTKPRQIDESSYKPEFSTENRVKYIRNQAVECMLYMLCRYNVVQTPKIRKKIHTISDYTFKPKTIIMRCICKLVQFSPCF